MSGASREQSKSEAKLKEVFNWFPSLFTSLFHLVGSSFRMTARDKADFVEDLNVRIDYAIKGLQDLKTLIKEQE